MLLSGGKVGVRALSSSLLDESNTTISVEQIELLGWESPPSITPFRIRTMLESTVYCLKKIIK